jgi:hypothetical protein
MALEYSVDVAREVIDVLVKKKHEVTIFSRKVCFYKPLLVQLTAQADGM